MADVRTSFAILEDVATGAGLPLHKALEGDAIAGVNAHGALVAKDPSSNFAYLKTNVNGALIISDQAATANLSATGTAVGNSAFTAVATMTLTPNKTYEKIAWMAGCYRDAEFKIQQNNNAVLSDVALGILMGSGAESEQLDGLTVTAGTTGTQTLVLMVKNQNTLSDFRGTLAALAIS